MSTLMPLSVTVGKDISWQFQVTLDGVAVNLSPYTVLATVKPKNTSPDSAALATYSSPSNGITVTNAAQGLVTLTVPNANVQTAGIFWWRMDITAGSLVYDVFSGPFTVYPA